MHTVQLLKNLVEDHQFLAYVVIFLGLVFEGEFVLICSGILIHLGALSLVSTVVFIVVGGFFKTFSFYYLGRMINKKWSTHKFLKYLSKKMARLMPHFKQRPFWSIFISKFIIGTNYLVMLFSGYEEISLKIYLRAEIISTALWASGLLSLGYFFSYTALHISREITRFSLIVLLLLIAFFAFDKLVAWLYEVTEEFYSNGNGNNNDNAH